MLYSELSHLLKIGDGISFPSLLNSLPMGLVLCSGKGHIEFMNTRSIALFKLQTTLNVGKESLIEFIEEKTKSIVYNAFLRIADLKSYAGIHTFICSDGSLFIGELKLSLCAEDGASLITATIDDITESNPTALKLNEEFNKYRLLAENMRDVIWSVDTNMIFTYISPSDKLLRGFDQSEVIGRSLFDFIPGEFRPGFMAAIEVRLQRIANNDNGDSVALESEILCKDGTTIWIEIQSNPIFDSSGSLTGFQGVARDIRSRKEMELALRDADERYKTVVSNAPIVLFEIDSKGIFRLSEGGALKKIGLKPAQVVGISAFDIYKDYPEICGHIRRALAGEIVHEKINVNGVIFDIFYHPVLSRRKKITSLIGIAVEITDKDKTEQLLIESEEKFRTLFESMAEGVALHDLVFNAQGEPVNYRINEVNPSYLRHTGLDLSMVRGKLATQVYRTEEPPYFEEFSGVALTGKPFNYETYFPPLERFFRISVVCTGKNRFATVFEDITMAKNREKELKNKNEELEKFTYTVSHDLRSPLVTIKGFIGMLQQDISDGNIEGVADDIRRINLAADKMADLLNDLLELSQVGRIINPPIEISMNQIVEDTVELLTGIIDEHKVTICILNDLPVVHVDKQRLAEVWQNLIENAIKFTSNQQNPKIEIGSFKDYGETVFFIRDNGQGIDPRYHETIFGLFNKLDTKTPGTGIGLSLVQRIIDIHGGRIWVESEGINKGATFKFTIPTKA